MYVIGGTASKYLAEDLSTLLQFPLGKTISKRFPDRELYTRIVDDLSGEDVTLVQTTYPDENIIELFLLQDAIKEADAKSLTLIIPYFGYGRQDKKFENGEPVSAKALATLISINADRVITVDPHKKHILGFFSIPAYSCSAVPEMGKYFKNLDIELILAPDKGALERAKQISTLLNCDFDYLEKTRIDSNTVEIKPKHLDVSNKSVVIIDDIISTGGTMALSIQELKNNGAKKIIASCTHGLFAGNAVNKLMSAGCDEIISTDTIQSQFSKVKIAPSIVHVLKNLR